jgi:hypothetical protein
MLLGMRQARNSPRLVECLLVNQPRRVSLSRSASRVDRLRASLSWPSAWVWASTGMRIAFNARAWCKNSITASFYKSASSDFSMQPPGARRQSNVPTRALCHCSSATCPLPWQAWSYHTLTYSYFFIHENTQSRSHAVRWGRKSCGEQEKQATAMERSASNVGQPGRTKRTIKNTQESVNNAYMTLLVASSPFFPSLPDLQVTIRIERTGVSASLGLLEEEGELLQ